MCLIVHTLELYSVLRNNINQKEAYLNSGKYEYKRLMPYLVAFLLFVLTIYLPFHLISYLGNGSNWDEGIAIYGAKRILDGQVLYRDFFDIVTPFTDYIVAIAYWFFGTSLKVARLTIVIANGLAVVILWFTSLRIIKNKFMMFIPSVIMIGYSSRYFSVSHHWFALDGIILTLFLTIKCTLDDHRINVKWIIPGIATAFVFLTMQSTGLALYGMLVIFIAWYFRYRDGSLKDAAKSFGYLSMGFFVPVLFVFVLFYLAGALNPMLYDLFIWPWGHYTMTNNASYIKQIIYYPVMFKSVELILIHIFADYIFVFIVMLTGIAFLIKDINPIKTPHRDDTTIMTVTVILIAGFASTMINPTGNLFIFYLPLDILFIIILIENYLTNRRLSKGILFTCLFLLSLVTVYESARYYRGTDNFIHSSYCVKKQMFAGMIAFPQLPNKSPMQKIEPDVLSLVEVFDGHFPKKVFILYWSPMFYFLSGAENPTMLNTYTPCYNTKAQAEIVIRQLEKSKPHYVILDNYLTLLKYQPYRNINSCVFDTAQNIILQWIITHYVFKQAVPSYTIYVRKRL